MCCVVCCALCVQGRSEVEEYARLYAQRCHLMAWYHESPSTPADASFLDRFLQGQPWRSHSDTLLAAARHTWRLHSLHHTTHHSLTTIQSCSLFYSILFVLLVRVLSLHLFSLALFLLLASLFAHFALFNSNSIPTEIRCLFQINWWSCLIRNIYQRLNEDSYQCSNETGLDNKGIYMALLRNLCANLETNSK